MPSSTFADRVLVSLLKRRHVSQLSLRALLKANQHLGLTFGLQLAEKRDSGERWILVDRFKKELGYQSAKP